MPFSDGPAMCPGRHVVLSLASEALAVLLAEGEDVHPVRASGQKVPGTLDPFRAAVRVGG